MLQNRKSLFTLNRKKRVSVIDALNVNYPIIVQPIWLCQFISLDGFDIALGMRFTFCLGIMVCHRYKVMFTVYFCKADIIVTFIRRHNFDMAYAEKNTPYADNHTGNKEPKRPVAC